jgi:hypothetical protein
VATGLRENPFVLHDALGSAAQKAFRPPSPPWLAGSVRSAANAAA